MATDERSENEGIKSTDTMFEILNEIGDRDGAGVSELADAVGLSKSTAHDHLTSLRRNRCVVKQDGEYCIGLRFLNFGAVARNRYDLYNFAKPEVDRLAEETEETAQVLIEEHGRGIYVYQARGKRAVKTDSHIGTEVYLHCTAIGKSVLAYLPEDRIDEIIDRHGMPAMTANTVTDREELFDELERIRSRGYALDDCERIAGLRCVAAPIKTDDGEIKGALSVNGPEKYVDHERFTQELPDLVQQAARIVEINATYS